MTLQFTNTATRTKEPFVPIDANNVRMYVCGPTVYDFAHIGNARPAVVFDVLFRLLRHVYGDDHVTYVRNITDVDDKINARAKRDFPDLPLNEAIARVTEKTTAQYHADLKALGCLEPSHEPRATAHIAGMIEMIQKLLDDGFAYIARGEEGREALFDVKQMPRYGSLSKRNLGEQQAGARVAVEGHKRNPEDFVLWKESSEDEPGWPAAFVVSEENQAALQLNSNEIQINGRPGWHIECSVMSEVWLWEKAQDKLGEQGLKHPHQFDIHGGGLDLIFPHHENEIAQSCCAHGTERMANLWLHNGFVQVEGRKMSKSEGNFVTIHDVLHTDKVGGRSWPGEVVRLALLMTHYREPMDFSVKRLEEAENTLSKFARRLEEGDPSSDDDIAADSFSSLWDDLNLPETIRYMHSMSGGTLSTAMEAIGLQPVRVQAHLSDQVIARRIEQRLALIAEKNWAEADRIRDELSEQGIQLKDGKDPETGERTTTWEVKR
ncbi:MAG: cysteine--tRNA ligase [Hyphomicrobiales bacterium]|jgi:cysteinyl-tRNA synthetase